MGHVGKDSRKRIVMTKRREDKRGACVLYCIIVFTSFGKKKVNQPTRETDQGRRRSLFTCIETRHNQSTIKLWIVFESA